MSESKVPTPSFNAWTDAWLPLVQVDGTKLWASPVEVLSGEKDGVDLDYPRDDFRVYARLLLSALVQALFAAEDKAALLDRLDKPMSRPDIEARLAPVLDDFNLFGPTPFLQILPPANPPDKGAAPFVFPAEDLFRSAVPLDGIALPIALVMVFIEHSYAGGAGRGYGAGPGGQPGALTLISPGSIRAGAWANSLTTENAARLYADDGLRPWSNEKAAARPRASIGLVRGLFFQPRSIWLIPIGVGVCSFSGEVGPLVRRSPFLPKSELTKKPSGGEDLWQHPCAPLAVKSQGIAAVRLHADRPVWTGLAQLLAPISTGKAKKEHPREGPAPVLEQWKTLHSKRRRPRLLILDFDRDKANVKRRFFESFPLTDVIVGGRDVVDRLRALVDDAQEVCFSLVKTLTKAHDDRKQGGLALADAETAFWTSTEAPFLDWLAAVASIEVWSDEAEAAVDVARNAMRKAMRRTALAIFDEHVSLSEFDARKQARVALARRALGRALYPKPKGDSLPQKRSEVMP